MDRGFVITRTSACQASIPTVYAVGAIVPGICSSRIPRVQQGIFVAEELAGLNPIVIADVNIPKVTCSGPEVASVELTEAKAIAEFGADKVSAYDYNLAGNGKDHIIGTSGSVKVVRVNDGPVVGVHMIGAQVERADRRGAQLAVNWEAYPEDIAPLHPRAPTQERGAGRGLPRARWQAPTRSRTEQYPNYSSSWGP